LITDGVMRLMQFGVVDASAKGIDRGVSDRVDRGRNRAQVASASSHYPPPRGAQRIVSRLSGPVSTPRSDGSVVVTEYGVADLRGCSIHQRRERLLAIAHADHQDDLFHHWHLDWSAVGSPTD
jgi:acyl-CoA hydrolase